MRAMYLQWFLEGSHPVSCLISSSIFHPLWACSLQVLSELLSLEASLDLVQAELSRLGQGGGGAAKYPERASGGQGNNRAKARVRLSHSQPEERFGSDGNEGEGGDDVVGGRGGDQGASRSPDFDFDDFHGSSPLDRNQDQAAVARLAARQRQQAEGGQGKVQRNGIGAASKVAGGASGGGGRSSALNAAVASNQRRAIAEVCAVHFATHCTTLALWSDSCTVKPHASVRFCTSALCTPSYVRCRWQGSCIHPQHPAAPPRSHCRWVTHCP